MASLPAQLTARQRIDSIHYLMRERICWLEYVPLSVLREAKLAQEFGCSRVWYQKMPQFWAGEVVALVDELTELIGAAQRHDVVALGYISVMILPV